MRKRDPRTKEELLDRMLSFDFDGDIRHLGVETASVVRSGPNRLLLSFPDSGVTFELTVHRPREFSQHVAKAAPQRESRSFSPSGGGDGLRRLEQEPEAPAPTKRRYTRRQPAQRSA